MRAACDCRTDLGCDELVFTVGFGRGIDMEQVIYVSDHSGSPKFFVKVKETAKLVWLRRIGSKQVDGDWMYGHCVADPDKFVNVADVRMMKFNGYLWNTKERLYATEWDGQPVTVYCD